MILVDTSVWIDFINDGNSVHCETLNQLIEDEEDICITEIILMEILQGIKSDRVFRRVKNYLLEFPIYGPRGVETYLKAAQIYRDCRKRGLTVSKAIDCIIAAIAIEDDLPLFHRDSDFDLIAACTPLLLFIRG